METNKQWKRVPFDIELAKKIQSGEVEGRIVTSENLLVRIVDFNLKDKTDSIVYIGTYANGEQEFIQTCDNEGKSFGVNVLYIELPEETPKHDFIVGESVKIISGLYSGRCGTIEEIIEEPLTNKAKVSIAANLHPYLPFEYIERCSVGSRKEAPTHEFKVGDYVQYGEGKFFKEKLEIVKIDNSIPNNVWIECSTEDGLINIKCPILEVKPYEEKHEFKPFDKVLVRDSEKLKWKPTFFNKKDGIMYVALDGRYWNYCIPYEGNEHLVGTTDNPE